MLSPTEQLEFNSYNQCSLRLLREEIKQQMTKYESKDDAIIIVGIDSYTKWAKETLTSELTLVGWQIMKGTVDYATKNPDEYAILECWLICDKKLRVVDIQKAFKKLDQMRFSNLML